MHAFDEFCLTREMGDDPAMGIVGAPASLLRRIVAGSSAIFAAITAYGCSPATQPGGSHGTALRFATDWRAEAEQGGFYEALADGEFARRGLRVTLIPGGPGVNIPRLLAAGAVDLGIGSNSFVVMNLAASGIPVKAVAAFMQKDPQVLIAHPSAGIARIADMRGHPILLADASIDAFWVWLKRKYGFTDDQVRKYDFSNAPFLANKYVVQQGYVTSEPYTIERQSGVTPLVFLLADEGYPGYAAMVLAPDRLIASKPDAVGAFVQAAAAGWRRYLWGDPRPGDALILKSNPEMTEDILAQARAKMRQYNLVGPEESRLGRMSNARWAAFFSAVSTAGLYPKTLDYSRAYTLRFVASPAGQP